MLLTIIFILIIVFALIYNMANGWNDAAGAVATIISTRVLSPTKAIVLGAVLNFVGALLSIKVAETVGRDVADTALLAGIGGMGLFLAAVVTAPIWITFCSRRGLPTSCSHALLGALVGAVLASSGMAGLNGRGIQKILFGVLVCPPAGFILGYAIVWVVTRFANRLRPAFATWLFGKLQLASASAMAIAHGTGDAQKAMGIIGGAWLTWRLTHGAAHAEFEIPWLARIGCALTMALGTSLGGWAVMKTLGSKLVHLRTYQGFSAETAAATTILINTLSGIPLSTTHAITSAIMGVGAKGGVRTVRWGVGKKIVFAWIVTFPVCIAGGAMLCTILRHAGIR